jgi:hypothetical protein
LPIVFLKFDQDQDWAGAIIGRVGRGGFHADHRKRTNRS